jgi:hypothetical protein
MRVNLDKSMDQVALQAGKPDADPFDLLCHLAFTAPACPDEACARRGMVTGSERSFSLSASNAPRPSDGRGIKGEGLRESGERTG